MKTEIENDIPKPILIEQFSDNGEFSHWHLIDQETSGILWSSFPEETIARGGKILNNEKIEENKSDDYYFPYCKICSACGEDGCCSAMMCEQSKDGLYCNSYMRDLKFGYLMFHDMYDLIQDDENKKKLDEIYDMNWNRIYNKKPIIDQYGPDSTVIAETIGLICECGKTYDVVDFEHGMCHKCKKVVGK